MSEEISKFNNYVIGGVLSKNKFDIKSVGNLETIKSTRFEKSEYPIIIGLIKKGEFSHIKDLESFEIKPIQYLEVMKFTDQNKRNFIVTVYDSSELMQDPQIIDIIPI